MADEKQVKLLKQGVVGWNKWREENTPDLEIDLLHANLRMIDLEGANLKNADLRGADLTRTNLTEGFLADAFLSGAILFESILVRANLCRADLSRVNFESANLLETDLSEANLFEANLRDADLTQAKLIGANLNGAELYKTYLNSTLLGRANLSRTRIGETIFSNIDLQETQGLIDVIHMFPSIIASNTHQSSKGKIPEKFLRGCGLSDWEIESAKLYQPELSLKEVNDIVYKIYDLRATQAIQINNLFISYSHKDKVFVDEMEKYLDKHGIRFWRDIHDATAGRLEKVVDRAIRQNPIVLLVLSKDSVASDWVEHEARSARALEKELGHDVLCPITLDDAWKECSWPARLREQIMEYHILDFSKWKDEGVFDMMFRKLVDGLDLFYKV